MIGLGLNYDSSGNRRLSQKQNLYESCKDFASSLVEAINGHKSLKNELNSIVCTWPLLWGLHLQLLWASLRLKVAGFLG